MKVYIVKSLFNDCEYISNRIEGIYAKSEKAEQRALEIGAEMNKIVNGKHLLLSDNPSQSEVEKFNEWSDKYDLACNFMCCKVVPFKVIE